MYIVYRACGTFLPNSSYLRHLFSKGLRRDGFTICRCCTQINAQRIRIAMEVSGSKQKQVFHQENLQPKNVQGCTFFSDAILGSSGRIVSIFLQVTRTLYFLVQCSCQGAVQKLQFLDSFLRFRCDV